MRKFPSSNGGDCSGEIYGATISNPRQQGFSLVEVTLSIGVIAFAFVALMGLLPTGLSVFREAMDTTVTAQIAQRITSELQETDYYALLRMANLDGSGSDPVTNVDPSYGVLPIRYFDDQGNEIRSRSDTGSLSDEERLRVLYEAHVRLARDHQILGQNPSGASERLGTRNMTTVLIQVISNPTGQEVVIDSSTKLVDTTQTKLPIQSYPAFIARNGSEARSDRNP